MTKSHYGMLALNLGVSGIVMYFAMYAMIDTAADLYLNLNNLYMVAMMVAPMGVLMLLLMGSMYRNKRLNLALHVGFVAMFALAFWLTRTQTAIGDDQFLRSMIPHHSGAILMCREASIADPEIIALCGNIERSQRAEIDQMNRILARY
jgi:uncharacterized protein (DUF305 family)